MAAGCGVGGLHGWVPWLGGEPRLSQIRLPHTAPNPLAADYLAPANAQRSLPPRPSSHPPTRNPRPPTRRAAADYIALANVKHTLALSGVPVFTAANRQAAYRFVTLVDVLYEHR